MRPITGAMFDFSSPRVISDGSEIPPLFPYSTVPLVKTGRVSPARLRELGAREGKNGWFVKATADLDLNGLADLLPRFAQRSVTPQMPDLIPASSWHSSLANVLVASSWKGLSKNFSDIWQGCEECGRGHSLECHEKWSYDENTGIQKLMELRTLCDDCHEFQHLGFAKVSGRLDRALERMMFVNRLHPHEVPVFYDQIAADWERRSAMDWTLDLSRLGNQVLTLKGNVQQIASDMIEANASHGLVRTRIAGMRIDASQAKLRLIGPFASPAS